MSAKDKPRRVKYADKLRRKNGSGTVDPRWMWWMESPEGEPRKLAIKPRGAQ